MTNYAFAFSLHGFPRWHAFMDGVQQPHDEVGRERLRHADATDLQAEMDLRFPEVPDHWLLYSYLVYLANEGEATYFADRAANHRRVGTCARTLRERGYDPADIADIKRRLS